MYLLGLSLSTDSVIKAGREIGRVRPSVCLFFILFSQPADVLLLFSASVWAMTIARWGLKTKPIGLCTTTNTRGLKYKLCMPRCTASIREKVFVDTVNVWNALPFTVNLTS